jgi:hypothetical protein
MKKLFVIIILASICIFDSFAQSLNFDATTGLNSSLIFITNDHDLKTNVTNTAIPIELNASYFFTNRIGINVYINYNFVTSLDGEIVNTDGSKATFNESHFKTVHFMQFFVGPIFELLNRKNFSLPLAVGLHVTSYNAVVDVPKTIWASYFSSVEYTGTQFGIGATFGFRYIFNNGLYVLARIQGSVDFLGKIEPEGKSLTYYFYPTKNSFALSAGTFIGVGYQFKF